MDFLERPTNLPLERLYASLVGTESDIWEHLPKLREIASGCEHVTEMGTRTAVSTAALLAARPRRLVCYDIQRSSEVDRLLEIAPPTKMEFRLEDVRTCTIEETDFLFIDTWHVREQLHAELTRHAPKVSKYIALHDTTTFGDVGETAGHDGLWPAVVDFLRETRGWIVSARFVNNNGLSILSRL